MKYKKYNPTTPGWTVKEFVEEIYPVTYVDTRIQRKGGLENLSGWSADKASEYVRCFWNGETGNDILLVHLPSALNYAKEKECQYSIEYYTRIIEGASGVQRLYLSIDGQNSASSINAWCTGKRLIGNNEEPLKAKVMASCAEMTSARAKEDHRDAWMGFYYGSHPSAIVLNNILAKDIEVLFGNINKNPEPLGQQEIRGATLRDISIDIGNRADNQTVKDVMRWMFAFGQSSQGPAKCFDKKEGHELYAQLYLKAKKGYASNCSHKILDDLYKNKNPDKTVLSQVDSLFANLSKCLGDYVPKQERIHNSRNTPRFLMLLFMEIFSMGYTVKKKGGDRHRTNYKSFFKRVSNKVKELHSKDCELTVEQSEQIGLSQRKLNMWYRSEAGYTIPLCIRYIQDELDIMVRQNILDDTKLHKNKQSQMLADLYVSIQDKEYNPLDIFDCRPAPKLTTQSA